MESIGFQVSKNSWGSPTSVTLPRREWSDHLDGTFEPGGNDPN